MNIKTTPDNSVVEYYVLVRDKMWSDSIVAGYGESMLATLVMSPSAGSWQLTAANEAVWSGLSPKTEYVCHIVVNAFNNVVACRTNSNKCSALFLGVC